MVYGKILSNLIESKKKKILFILSFTIQSIMNTDIVLLSSSEDEKDLDEICNREQSSNMQLANKNNEKGTNLRITVEDRKKNYNSTKIVIEIDDLPCSQETQSPISNSDTRSILQIERDNFTAEFNTFLDLCIDYEFCDGMIQILKKKLIPVYNAADKQYIQSRNFRMFIKDLIIKFKKYPQYKFSHIKRVCEELKMNCTKKRVDLITLSNKVSDHRKRHFDGREANVQCKAKKITEIIDLDNDMPIIDLELEDKTDDVILMEDECDGKENSSSEINTAGHQCKNDSLLKEDTKVSRLKYLEEKIEKTHKKIKQLELAEVDDDKCSAYIYCDTLKGRIVQYYYEYCALQGELDFQPSPADFTVNVMEGHPTGPARKLKEWLNENLNECRTVFPDIVDVIKCVKKASDEDNLGWNTNRILNEARILFVACGKALQKRRQKREWKDLKYKIKKFGDNIDCDPADNDPELSARLEANRRIAIKKENELIDYYSKLQSAKQPLTNSKNILLQAAPSNLNVPTDNTIMVSHRTTRTSDSSNNGPIAYNENKNISCQNEDIPIKAESCQIPIDPNIEIVCSDSEDYSTSENEDSDLELDDLLPADNNNVNDINKEDLNRNNNECLEIKKEIKTEDKSDISNQSKEMTAEETLKMLLEFDNNATSFNLTTVLGSEVVTIEMYSSDSDSDCEILTDDDSEGGVIEPQNRPIGAVVEKSSQLPLS